MEADVRVTVIATGFDQKGTRRDPFRPDLEVKQNFSNEDLDIPPFLRRGRNM
jgi:cell division protein FtsZ